MIHYTEGNLLDAEAEALVNTVNEVGVMGKGIALMFREAFPKNMEVYEEACKSGDVRVGRMLTTENHALVGPRWIINFPTKKHWCNPSKLELTLRSSVLIHWLKAYGYSCFSLS